MSATVTAALVSAGNAGKLQQSLASVQSQTQPPSEILVVAPNLAETPAWVRRTAGVKVIQQVAPGLPGARNAGISQASSKWISFLNEGDVWDPARLRVLGEYLDAHQDCRAIHHAVHIAESGEVRRSSALRVVDFLRAEASPAMLSSAMVTREALLFAGIMNVLVKVNSDHDCFIRVAFFDPFDYVDQPLATVGAISPDGPATFREEYASRNLMAMIYEDLFRDPRASRRFAAELNGRYLARALRAGDFSAAFNILGRYARMQRASRTSVILQALRQWSAKGLSDVH